MVTHILIPTDGSECATAAVKKAVDFAAELKSKVTFLVVTEPFRMLTAEAAQIERVRSEFLQYQREHADSVLEAAQEVARQAGVSCTALRVEGSLAYETIIDSARRCGADMIAMGSHGIGGVRGLVLGSVAQKVLTHCQLPVLIFR